MLGIEQPAGESFGFQEVEHRFPVIAGGFHRHQLHPFTAQPIGQLQQRPRQCRVLADLLAAPSGLVLVRHPQTSHQAGLTQIQRGYPLNQLDGFIG
jgi:hypothetical protein